MTNTAQELEDKKSGGQTIAGVPRGYESVYLAKLVCEKACVLHIASDDAQFEQISSGLDFFAPDVTVLRFPAWDCLPYDRVSPTAEIMGERLAALSALMQGREGQIIILTTIAAVTQRVPPRSVLEHSLFSVHVGDTLDRRALQSFLAANGYHRAETVREAGEFALRGSLIDIFPSSADTPLRLDLFGDDVETIRYFDALTQRTIGDAGALSLYPVSEVLLTDDTIQRFRSRYRAAFGAMRDEDPLYESISAGRRYAGMEHWMAFFYETLDTLFDYAPDAVVTCDHQIADARAARIAQVDDLYESRRMMMDVEKKAGTHVYRPVPAEDMYLPAPDTLDAHDTLNFVPFPPVPGQTDAGGRKGRDFADVRAQHKPDLYGAIKKHIEGLRKPVLIAAYSEGSATRLQKILTEHGVKVSGDPKAAVRIAILALEHGFETQDFAVLTEQDLLGDRLARMGKKKKKNDAVLFELSQLREGDYVVHNEHGIGQFIALETLTVSGAAHDCLKLLYSGGDKLFVPVENLDVLTRYGSEEAGAILDKLGGTAWQGRRARVKKDLLAIAEALMDIAAARVLRQTEPIHILDDLYEKFCAGFPYPETEDQQKSIDAVLADLQRPQPMDRLVCGDVGFGKTEVALRAAAAAAFAGFQVALIAPTTLLARQHYLEFQRRFHGFPVRVGLLSRFVTGKDANRAKQDAATGGLNIVIGTHALLSESVKFNNLALMVVDEEQKFGVKQKERLKELKEDVHVLTLTATPIPRTLQMALTGVRDLSLITTAPIDRLAARTFVLPFDPVIIRDALMREHYRGGQSFYVCPRVSDLREVEETLNDLVPELKIVVAHGRLGAEEMEEKMTAFYEGAYDILLSTSIIESGLDIPNANTMVVHRADMFGLAQLYQIRGRIGRSRQRAYAYITYKPDKKLTKSAQQRLHVLEQLDQLGAGFQLASHDLDLRGAGNLLGEEQSGHIREIGIELYQQMLEEAVAAAKSGGSAEDAAEASWSPVINLGLPVMIPEGYIKDLNLRLSIYRRIAALQDRSEIDGFAAELVDRFGPLPEDVDNLFDLVEIKQLCRAAGVDRIDAGPKGAVVSFHPTAPLNMAGLVQYIAGQMGTVKLRAEDQKLVFMRPWEEMPQRIKGVHKVLGELADI